MLQHVDVRLSDVNSHRTEPKAKAFGATLQNNGRVEVPSKRGHIPVGRAITGAGAGASWRAHLGQHKVLYNNQSINIKNRTYTNMANYYSS